MTAKCQCATQTVAELGPDTWKRVDAVIARYQETPGALMPVLQEVQEIVGYLPPAVQERIAAGLKIQGSEVFGVMSFYSMYTWKPKGKYVIRVCESPPCHVNGAENMLEALQEELGLAVGETTADGLLYPGKNRLSGGLRSCPGHADQRGSGRPPDPGQDQAGAGRLPGRPGAGLSNLTL